MKDDRDKECEAEAASETPGAATPPQGRRSGVRRALRWTLRSVLVFVAGIVTYLLAALVLGLIPVNSDWVEPEDGIEIFVISNGVHCDFILPADNPLRDWRVSLPLSVGEGVREEGREDTANWVRFGWGERRFYLETPQWADLRFSVAAAALFWPTSTLMHVEFVWSRPEESDYCRRLKVSEAQFKSIVEHIESFFARDAKGEPRRLDGRGYFDYDDFYEAVGSYHLLYTCNDWVNIGLRRAGIRAAAWSPFDTAILYQLAPK